MTKSVRKVLVGAAFSSFVFGYDGGCPPGSAEARGNILADSTGKTKVAKHCCAGKNYLHESEAVAERTKGKNSLLPARVDAAQRPAAKARAPAPTS